MYFGTFRLGGPSKSSPPHYLDRFTSTNVLAQRFQPGYLQEFLFTPERARRPARYLSGGERNRLLLARIFKRPSNLMVLDEPTNDLDSETLELLEELVTNYQGTLLLVSHDRAFLNNVVTSTLVFEEDGRVKDYSGGYDDYLRQRDQAAAQSGPEPVEKMKPRADRAAPRKRSWNESRELEAIPEQIEQLETQQSELHAAMSEPEFYRQDGAEIAAASERLAGIEADLETLMQRWEELEAGG